MLDPLTAEQLADPRVARREGGDGPRHLSDDAQRPAVRRATRRTTVSRSPTSTRPPSSDPRRAQGRRVSCASSSRRTAPGRPSTATSSTSALRGRPGRARPAHRAGVARPADAERAAHPHRTGPRVRRLDAVEATLEDLAARDDPLVVHLPRQTGQKETRWMHLLAGPVDVDAVSRRGARRRRPRRTTSDRVSELAGSRVGRGSRRPARIACWPSSACTICRRRRYPIMTKWSRRAGDGARRRPPVRREGGRAPPRGARVRRHPALRGAAQAVTRPSAWTPWRAERFEKQIAFEKLVEEAVAKGETAAREAERDGGGDGRRSR